MVSANDAAARGQASKTRGPEEVVRPPYRVGWKYHPKVRISEQKRLRQRNPPKNKGASAERVTGEQSAFSLCHPRKP